MKQQAPRWLSEWRVESSALQMSGTLGSSSLSQANLKAFGEETGSQSLFGLHCIAFDQSFKVNQAKRS